MLTSIRGIRLGNTSLQRTFCTLGIQFVTFLRENTIMFSLAIDRLASFLRQHWKYGGITYQSLEWLVLVPFVTDILFGKFSCRCCHLLGRRAPRFAPSGLFWLLRARVWSTNMDQNGGWFCSSYPILHWFASRATHEIFRTLRENYRSLYTNVDVITFRTLISAR